jgi:hypothetical protein
MVETQFAEVDYAVKAQSKRIHDFFAGVHEVREGVRDARHRAPD